MAHTGLNIRKLYKADRGMWRVNLPKKLCAQIGFAPGDALAVSITTEAGMLLEKIPLRPLVHLDPGSPLCDTQT